MTKTLALTTLAAALTLTGIDGALASRVSTEVYGDIGRVRTTGYGEGPHTAFVIEGDDLDIEAFSGPCPGGRPSRTVFRGSGQHHLLIAPCNLD